jgi:hypothetical protein
MKPAIDSYHCYLGEVHAGLKRGPGSRITMHDFLDRAHMLGMAA